MELPEQRDCDAIAGEHPPPQDLRLTSQVLKVRPTRQLNGRHDGLLLPMPGIRTIRQKRRLML
jgi:hypothetical protein